MEVRAIVAPMTEIGKNRIVRIEIFPPRTIIPLGRHSMISQRVKPLGEEVFFSWPRPF
jgi:hypothetical protein